MATFIAGTAASFDLQVVSYAYDVAIAEDDYTANWLNICAVATNGDQRWQLEGEWCLTWELWYVPLWLEAVAHGNFNLFSTGGIEWLPDLEAHWEPPAEPLIRLETADGDGGVTPEEWVTLWFPYNPAALRAFSEALLLDLRDFPIRQVETKGPAQHHLDALADFRKTNALHTAVQRKDRTLPLYVEG